MAGVVEKAPTVACTQNINVGSALVLTKHPPPPHLPVSMKASILTCSRLTYLMTTTDHRIGEIRNQIKYT